MTADPLEQIRQRLADPERDGLMGIWLNKDDVERLLTIAEAAIEYRRFLTIAEAAIEYRRRSTGNTPDAGPTFDQALAALDQPDA